MNVEQKLNHTLKDIEESHERCIRAAGRALDNLPRVKRPSSYQSFILEMAKINHHVLSHIMGGLDSLSFNPIFQTRSSNILRKVYGQRKGEYLAFEIARDGGLREVVQTIASHVAQECSESVVQTKVSDFWKSLSTDEKIEAGHIFLKKHGNLFPPDVVDNGAPRLRGYLPQFLYQYPRLKSELRKVGR